MRCAPHRCRRAFHSCIHLDDLHSCLDDLHQFHKQLTCQLRTSLITKRTAKLLFLLFTRPGVIRLGWILVHNSTIVCLANCDLLRVRLATVQLTPAQSVQLTPPRHWFSCELLPGVMIGEQPNFLPIILHHFVIRMKHSRLTYPKCSWRQMNTYLVSEISLFDFKTMKFAALFFYVKNLKVAYVKVAVISVLNDRWHHGSGSHLRVTL